MIDERKEYFSVMEKETQYLIDLLTQINKEYSEIVRDKLLNRRNRLAMLTFKADILALFKFLRAKMLKSRIELNGEKKYLAVVAKGDKFEKHLSKFTDEDSINLYNDLTEFVEEEGLIKKIPSL